MNNIQPGLASIIMPVYNGEQYLRQAIDSVLAQTCPHWELVVVDDGSTDSTSAIVHSFSDERIRYTYEQNRGQTTALNRGLELARGEYVTTLDADDWLNADSLQARVDCLAAHEESGVAYGDGYYSNAAGKPGLGFHGHMASVQ